MDARWISLRHYYGSHVTHREGKSKRTGHQNRSQGFEEKLAIAREIISDQELQPEQVCFIGDDLTDIPVIKSVGLGVAVADAAEEVKLAAAHTTKLGGGQGAIRELTETILKAKNRWAGVIQRYVK